MRSNKNKNPVNRTIVPKSAVCRFPYEGENRHCLWLLRTYCPLTIFFSPGNVLSLSHGRLEASARSISCFRDFTLLLRTTRVYVVRVGSHDGVPFDPPCSSSSDIRCKSRNKSRVRTYFHKNDRNPHASGHCPCDCLLRPWVQLALLISQTILTAGCLSSYQGKGGFCFTPSSLRPVVILGLRQRRPPFHYQQRESGA